MLHGKDAPWFFYPIPCCWVISCFQVFRVTKNAAKTIPVSSGLLPLQSEFFKAVPISDLGNTWKPLHVLDTGWYLEGNSLGPSTTWCGLQEALGRVAEISQGDWWEILFCTNSRERHSLLECERWGVILTPVLSLWEGGQPLFLGESGLTSHKLMAALPGHTSRALFFLIFFYPQLNIKKNWAIINIH